MPETPYTLLQQAAREFPDDPVAAQRRYGELLLANDLARWSVTEREGVLQFDAWPGGVADPAEAATVAS